MLGVSGITVGDEGEINSWDLNCRDAMLGVSGRYNACDLNTKRRQAWRLYGENAIIKMRRQAWR